MQIAKIGAGFSAILFLLMLFYLIIGFNPDSVLSNSGEFGLLFLLILIFLTVFSSLFRYIFDIFDLLQEEAEPKSIERVFYFLFGGIIVSSLFMVLTALFIDPRDTQPAVMFPTVFEKLGSDPQINISALSAALASSILLFRSHDKQGTSLTKIALHSRVLGAFVCFAALFVYNYFIFLLPIG